MPERKHEFCNELAKLRRYTVEIKLGFTRIADHFGLPQVSDEDIDKALAEEDSRRPVKPTTAAAGHLSTTGPSIHRQPRAALPIRDGEPR